MNYKKTMNFISSFLILIGIVGLFVGVAISLRLIRYKYELPLGNAEGIVVSNDGRIYLGLQFYGTIQSYDTNGKYLKNWNVDNLGGAFSLDIIDDVIIVATRRGNKLTKYDLDGNELSIRKIDNFYSNYKSSNQFVDNLNNLTYKINDGLFPSVSKLSKGQSKKIISMPILFVIFKGPMPAFLFILLGSIMRFWLNKEKIMKKLN